MIIIHNKERDLAASNFLELAKHKFGKRFRQRYYGIAEPFLNGYQFILDINNVSFICRTDGPCMLNILYEQEFFGNAKSICNFPEFFWTSHATGIFFGLNEVKKQRKSEYERLVIKNIDLLKESKKYKPLTSFEINLNDILLLNF